MYFRFIAELSDGSKQEDTDGGMGSESDTYFANLQCANSSNTSRKSSTMTVNMSFGELSPSFHNVLSNQNLDESTSGISSSSMPEESFSNSRPSLSVNINLKGQHTFTVTNGACSHNLDSSSQQNLEGESPSRRLRSQDISAASYLTHRRTTKRKSRRTALDGATSSDSSP